MLIHLRAAAWVAAVLICVAAGRAAAGPVYNGGSVISGTPDVYYIWYGDWTNNTAKSLIQTFTKTLNGTSYLNTDSSMSGNGHVAFMKSTLISAAKHPKLYLGTSLNGYDTTIQSIVTTSLGKGLLPSDPNGIYFVMTAPNINVSGFATDFCGWHDSTNWGGSSLGVQFAFVGDPTVAENGCYAQLVSPNNNFGADAMVSVIAHELIEATTDPLGTAWWDSNPSSRTYGYENADMCAWKFGTTYTTNNGAQANIKVGKKNFLLQQQWVNTGGGNGSCAMSYAGPPISGAPALVLADSGGAGLPVRAVPEPASLAVFSAGLIGLLAGVRRRRRERLA